MTYIRWVYGFFVGGKAAPQKTFTFFRHPVIARRAAPKQSCDAGLLCVGVNCFFIKQYPSCLLILVSLLTILATERLCEGATWRGCGMRGASFRFQMFYVLCLTVLRPFKKSV